MKALRLVLFTLTFLGLSAQLIRHVYIRWFEPTESILDKYELLDKKIKNANSLEQLEKLYAEELKKAGEKAEAKAKKASDSVAGNKDDADFDPANDLPSNSRTYAVRAAIQDWEGKAKEVKELRYFWCCGLLCLLLAVTCHWRKWYWLSLTLQIAGFTEMLWWTSPSFRNLSMPEFTRLLENKILFTILSLAILLLFWFIGFLQPKDDAAKHAA